MGITTTNRSTTKTISPLESFVLSAIAPSTAVLFTNPFDTAKVRLQLQQHAVSGNNRGKEAKQGALVEGSKRVYKNSFDCMRITYQHEGVRGLQKGLTPAILREGSKNIFRIGMYDPIMGIIHTDTTKSAPAWKRMVAGSICGVMGAVACNPFELVKTRLQSAAPKGIAVGHQHNYTGVVDALKSIYKQDGVPGMYKGSVLSMGRSIVGSGSNLAAYSMMKEYLMVNRNWDDNVMLDMVSGLASGVISCVAMNPIDVLRTRYYNQPWKDGVGVLYKSGWDAANTVVHNEGWLALYKGFTTHFLRIGPHFCLTFVFLGILRRGLLDFYEQMDGKYETQKGDVLIPQRKR